MKLFFNVFVLMTTVTYRNETFKASTYLKVKLSPNKRRTLGNILA